MKSAIKIIETGDGSHSLYHSALNETYHSTHGALNESHYVYIEQGLEHQSANPVEILEFGFGTGLNVLLTAIYADRHEREIHLTTLEAFPLDKEISDALNYARCLSDPAAEEWFQRIHDVAWEKRKKINPHMHLTKRMMRFEDFSMKQRFDLVYFDAFAPSRQPELWTKDILVNVVDALKEGGVFVTYSAMGQLKRDLASLGMGVETLDGPPGKKEMVRAVKPIIG